MHGGSDVLTAEEGTGGRNLVAEASALGSAHVKCASYSLVSRLTACDVLLTYFASASVSSTDCTWGFTVHLHATGTNRHMRPAVLLAPSSFLCHLCTARVLLEQHVSVLSCADRTPFSPVLPSHCANSYKNSSRLSKILASVDKAGMFNDRPAGSL